MIILELISKLKDNAEVLIIMLLAVSLTGGASYWGMGNALEQRVKRNKKEIQQNSKEISNVRDEISGIRQMLNENKTQTKITQKEIENIKVTLEEIKRELIRQRIAREQRHK